MLVLSTGSFAHELLIAPNWGSVSGYPQPPAIEARSALLFDMESRMVLFAENPEFSTPPASLTKVVAIHTAMLAVNRGELDLAASFVPPEPSWWTSVPPHSSLMFLAPDQRLTVRELLIGLAVPSGNDAAVALAFLLDGSVEAFAARMNREVAAEGVQGLFFVEPSGLSPRNRISARGYSELVYRHLTVFPELLDWLYNRAGFTYPQPHNITGPESPQPIEQRSRNGLLREDPSVDGLKTGYTEEAGYSLVATAKRDGRRLVAVVLGVDAPDSVSGARRREEMAASLLEYGFGSFTQSRFSVPPVDTIRIFRGDRPRITPVPAAPLVVTHPPGAEDRLDGRIQMHREVRGPFAANTVVGSVQILLDGTVMSEVPLIAGVTVEEGGWLRTAWDAVVLFFRRLIGRGEPADGSSLESVEPALLRRDP